MDTQDYGYIAIETGQAFLKEREENLLYRRFGVRVLGLQNLDTGEVDMKSLKLLELIDYNPKFDKTYLNSLIERAKNSWDTIDPDEWLLDVRGGYEA